MTVRAVLSAFQTENLMTPRMAVFPRRNRIKTSTQPKNPRIPARSTLPTSPTPVHLVISANTCMSIRHPPRPPQHHTCRVRVYSASASRPGRRRPAPCRPCMRINCKRNMFTMYMYIHTYICLQTQWNIPPPPTIAIASNGIEIKGKN